MSENHGNTPGAWAAVVVALVGFVVGGVGLMLVPANMVIFYVGLALALAGAILYLVVAKLGLD